MSLCLYFHLLHWLFLIQASSFIECIISTVCMLCKFIFCRRPTHRQNICIKVPWDSFYKRKVGSLKWHIFPIFSYMAGQKIYETSNFIKICSKFHLKQSIHFQIDLIYAYMYPETHFTREKEIDSKLHVFLSFTPIRLVTKFMKT